LFPGWSRIHPFWTTIQGRCVPWRLPVNPQRTLCWEATGLSQTRVLTWNCHLILLVLARVSYCLFQSILCCYNRIPQIGQTISNRKSFISQFWRWGSPR
jgi:hypothetical protein